MDCRANAETAEAYVRALAAQGADCRCLNPGTGHEHGNAETMFGGDGKIRGL